MKKRLLSAILCAVLLLGMLPALTPPARMVATDIWITVNRTTATVGDLLFWTLNVSPSTGDYQTRIKVYTAGLLVYNGDFVSGLQHSYTPRIPGPTYAEAVVYDKGDGKEITKKSIITTVAPLPAPSIVSVTSINARALRVTWNPVAGIDGYRVYFSTTPTGLYKLAGKTVGTTFAKTYLTAGVRYFFKVVGYNVSGGKLYDATRMSAYKAGVPMGVPTIATIKTSGVGRITLTWAKSAGASGFEVYRSTTATGAYAKIYTTTALSYTDTNLVRGRYYYYKILPYRRVYTTNYYGPFSAYRYMKAK